MKIEIKTGHYRERVGRTSNVRTVYYAAIVVGGIEYRTEASSDFQAMKLAFDAANGLGLPVGVVNS